MAIDFDIKPSSKIQGVYIITPNKFQDLRGEIWSAFISKDIDELLPEGLRFVHDKFITSKKNVIRGIHGDNKTYKLATCIFGEVHQVVVDLREGSSSYLQWEKFIINPQNQQIILVPAGCGNAHLVTSNEAVYYYKCAYDGEYIDANEQFTCAWNDARLNIDWGISNPILSHRDILATKEK